MEYQEIIEPAIVEHMCVERTIVEHVIDETIIDAARYLAIWRDQEATSRPERPRDPTFRTYVTTVADLMSAPLYPVWWTRPDRAGLLPHTDREATPITFQELLSYPALCEEILSVRATRSRGRLRPRPHLIVERCASSGVLVVKDGCKELLALLLAGSDSRIDVAEVAGHDWSGSMLDMRRILDHHARVSGSGRHG